MKMADTAATPSTREVERCHRCHVRDQSLCASLADDELTKLSTIGRRKVYPAGQVVAWTGDPNAQCANLVSGTLKITASTEDGREQIVALMHPGDFVGQPFADETPVTVTTLVDSDLCFFPRQGFEQVLDAHPRMERQLLRRTIDSLAQARERMLSLARHTAVERIAAFLIELIEHADGPQRENVEIEIPISRGEMADYLGLTIETVSRQLGRLKADGIVKFDRGGRACTVVSVARLRAIAYPR